MRVPVLPREPSMWAHWSTGLGSGKPPQPDGKYKKVKVQDQVLEKTGLEFASHPT